MLWDTYLKDGGHLFHHLPVHHLAPLVKQAREAGLLVVLAGSLGMEDLATIRSLTPDFVAVRGAVCPGSRVATVQQLRVSQFAQALATGAPQ